MSESSTTQVEIHKLEDLYELSTVDPESLQQQQSDTESAGKTYRQYIPMGLAEHEIQFQENKIILRPYDEEYESTDF